MSFAPKKLRELHADAAGASSVEWVLLLLTIGLPSFWLFSVILNAIAELYRMVTFVITTPFP